jgi:hypothetical protein
MRTSNQRHTHPIGKLVEGQAAIRRVPTQPIDGAFPILV